MDSHLAAVLQDSKVVEEEYIDLQDEALVKLDQSERDLEAALDIRNRTMTLLQLTQQQLLDVESKQCSEQAVHKAILVSMSLARARSFSLSASVCL